MQIGNFEVEVTRKNIKNVILKVYPNFKIKLSVPYDTESETIKNIVISKEKWINEKLSKYEEQLRQSKRDYVSGENHFLNGKRYILKVIDSNTPNVYIENGKNIIMEVRKSSSIENKEKLMNNFYKEQLEKKLLKFIPIWENKIGVKSTNFKVRKMKNAWGSCNISTKVINFNLDLAKKKDNEIQYVVVHELIHLIEKNHNEHFRSLMYEYYPKWENCHDSLNEIIGANKKI